VLWEVATGARARRREVVELRTVKIVARSVAGVSADHANEAVRHPDLIRTAERPTGSPSEASLPSAQLAARAPSPLALVIEGPLSVRARSCSEATRQWGTTEFVFVPIIHS
jgi:hypothetical protein